MSFFSSRSKAKARLVIAIEDSFVSAAVVGFSKNSVEVNNFERITISLEPRDPDQLLAALLRALGDCLSRLSTQLPRVETTEVVLGAPWVATRLVHTKDALPKPMTITRDGLRSFSKSVLQESPPEGTLAISRRVTRTLLNGYPTERPEQKTASSIELDVVECLIREDVGHAIEKLLVGAGAPGKIAFHSKVLPLARLMHSLGRDGSFLDICATTSQLLIVHHALLQQAQPLPWGYGRVLSLLNAQFPESARQVLEMVNDTEAPLPAGNVFETIASHESELVSEFGAFFSEVSTAHKMPNLLWISVPRPFEQWAVHFFSRIDFSQFTRTSRPFSVQIAPLDTLIYEPSVTGTIDPNLLFAVRAVYNTYLELQHGVQW